MIDPAVSSRRDTPWIGDDPRFTELRAAYRRFVFPVTAAFLLWFLAYVLCSAYARGFMATKVVGNVNVALVFGLLQFVSTFGIALAYSRFAARRLDPLAQALRSVLVSQPIAPAPAGRGGDQELTENQA
ncbi:DUF485 domain-containing protein [Kitasatospora kifunensis]|uniref:Uncharacterized membrane protein (DUF485 family) n=1 Tax=Kitasatospora kifunensis TaxID=58351 RepID=A0A7W7QYB8_KITKI|nr:DUF485 domain-containing protein [Kitasatospora kifunensis]MBB4921969.1 uncharacterized membrane protein (DUF485 family) [Kitasatospora kifunensis]